MQVFDPALDISSLDIEGAEMPVLRTIPWQKLNISVILIEVTQAGRLFEGSKEELREFLENRGFRHFKDVGFDQIYVRKEKKKIKNKRN